MILDNSKTEVKEDTVLVGMTQLYHLHHLNLLNRTIYLEYGQQVEGDGDTTAKNLSSASETIKNLDILHSIDPISPIRIILNTSGGDEGDGLAIYDFIRSLSNPVDIYVFGRCHSMGSWILQAARTRYMSRRATLMIHSGTWAPESDNYESALEWAEFTKKFEPRVLRVLLNRIRQKNPKYSQTELKAFIERDRPFNAEDAIRFGLVDKLIPEGILPGTDIVEDASDKQEST